MSPTTPRQFGPARIFALLIGVAAAMVVPVGAAHAAPVCGATTCIEIVANDPSTVIDLERGASISFAVTVSDPALLPLPVDFAIPDSLIVDPELVQISRLSQPSVTPIPGGMRVVIPAGADLDEYLIFFPVGAAPTLTAAEIVASTTFTDDGTEYTASARSAFEPLLTDLRVYLQSRPGPVPISHLGRSVVSFGAATADGPDDLVGSSVAMTMTVSPGFSLKPQLFGTPFAGRCDVVDARTVRCAGVWRSYYAVITADPGTPRGTTGTVTAALEPPVGDRNPTNDVLTLPIIDVGTADLAIDVTPVNPTVPVGGTGSLTVTVTNNGPDPADGAFLDLNALAILIDTAVLVGTPDRYTATINGQPVTDRAMTQVSLDGLASGASVSVPVTVTSTGPVVLDSRIAAYVYTYIDVNGLMCDACYPTGRLALTFADEPPPVTPGPSPGPEPTYGPSDEPTDPTTTVPGSTSRTSTTSQAGAAPGLANTGEPTDGLLALAVAFLLVGGVTTRLARIRRQ